LRETEQKAARAYTQKFGGDPDLVASAPGRINLIGEHTDYNGGFVLPCAIDRRIAVALGTGGRGEFGIRGGFETRLYSADFDEMREARDKDGSWADYPRGVVWAMGEDGHEIETFRAAFAGDVPLGSGLSSSAAIEAATALALDALFGFDIVRKDLAVLCQRAENDYVGVASGIMDQYASLLCEAGAALLVDCRSLEAKSVPLDLAAAGLVLVVCDTRVERGLADTGYNDRRSTCESAARTLGIEELRDATEGDLDRLSGEEQKRARHVVSENARVLEAVEALENSDFDEFGRLMYASHASLRDDYEVSTSELDTFVQTAQEHGAKGARLTGAGFGGCAIALVPEAQTDEVRKACEQSFAEAKFEDPEFHEVVPAAGAERAEQSS
jgi:galactokinase